MPSASVLRREWRRPLKTYASGFDRIGVGGGFRPGLTFDLYDPAGNRLGWGRVTGLGDIELFDAASNRLGSVRPTFRAFMRKARTYAPQQMEALKEGEILEIGPEGKRGVWRSIGGNPVFVAVKQGESVPDAVKRVQAKTGSGTNIRRGIKSVIGRSADFLKEKARVSDPGRAVALAEDVHRVIGTDVSLDDLRATYAAPFGLEEEEVSVKYHPPKRFPEVGRDSFVTFTAQGFIDGERADIVRTFRRGLDGGLEVGHELFDLPASAQGKGIAGRVYAAQEDLYRKMGVRKVSMIANGTIGKYAWALHGFDFSGGKGIGGRNDMVDHFNKVSGSLGATLPSGWWKGLKHSWEFATFTTGKSIHLDGALRSKILKHLPGKESELSDLKDGDYEFGKLSMILGRAWDAVKDYGPDGNSEGARIGRAYLSKKAKKMAKAVGTGGKGGTFGQDDPAFHAELGGWPNDGEGAAAVAALLETSLKKSIKAIIREHPDWDREQIKMELRRRREGGAPMTDTDGSD